MSLADWLSAFSLLCAAFAAWKAAAAVTQARLARRDDDRARREARLDREWQQLDKIGGLIEDIFLHAVHDIANVTFAEEQWKAARNRLRQLTAGSEHSLPHCNSLVQASGREQAWALASSARSEVEAAMRQTVARMQSTANGEGG